MGMGMRMPMVMGMRMRHVLAGTPFVGFFLDSLGLSAGLLVSQKRVYGSWFDRYQKGNPQPHPFLKT